MKKNVFFVLRLALTLLIITSLVAAALAGVNAVTEDRIAEREREKTRQAMHDVLPGEQYFKDYSGIMKGRGAQSWLDENGYQLPQIVTDVEASLDRPFTDLVLPGYIPSKQTGYAVEVRTTGFDGEIVMMVGVDTEGNVRGISIISHSETAGLGAVAGSDSARGQAFRDQFIGKTGELAVTKDGGTVDAISGATITSRAVTEGVDAAIEYVMLLERYLSRNEPSSEG